MIKKFADMIYLDNDVERLIILRKRLNKSQYEFAHDIGISTSYLGLIENYKYPFTTELKERIDQYLKQEQEIYEKDLFGHK
ncbi:helix-turn-helix transcriptional regulator [Bacillus sp. AFS040349]|uniref:helix-turn-helix transcriptional regulator n=1 Tax=Bacillus sp. AFS040349 TaxID=2033502 RepID=UPI000BFCBCC7|nr:helix-turn-helix transcriptional regulator [Bacillus sp. AFS040349]PGT80590.1 hypothetical protein COD11_20995 [Bacillus sp. AFS040349]